ncbi:unnamed protein product [Ectocarpus fasciculatus]
MHNRNNNRTLFHMSAFGLLQTLQREASLKPAVASTYPTVPSCMPKPQDSTTMPLPSVLETPLSTPYPSTYIHKCMHACVFTIARHASCRAALIYTSFTMCTSPNACHACPQAKRTTTLRAAGEYVPGSIKLSFWSAR